MNRREALATMGMIGLVPTLVAVPIPKGIRTTLPVWFKDVQEGECFWYAGKLHLKIKPVVYYYTDGRPVASYNAVDPETGESWGGCGPEVPVNDPRFNPEVEGGNWRRWMWNEASRFANRQFHQSDSGWIETQVEPDVICGRSW